MGDMIVKTGSMRQILMLEEAKHTYWVDGQNQIPLQTHNNTYIHIQQFEYSISAFKIENYFPRCLYPTADWFAGSTM